MMEGGAGRAGDPAAAPGTPAGAAACRSGPAVGDDEIRRHAQQEADAEHVEPELEVALAADAVPDLADHVEDRPAGQREEEQLERVARDLVADHRPQPRRPARDRPGEAQPAPGGANAA